jgi:hypothetical protein
LSNCGKEFAPGAREKGIRVQPGHCVGLTAFETVDFRRETVRKIYPDHDLDAFISPSRHLSRDGIVAPTTQVDASYHGILNWTVRNTSNEERRFLTQGKLFRLTVFKLAPGETPLAPHKGESQDNAGQVRSERKGARAARREHEWEDSRIQGGPEALLENLLKSGHPWNILGQRLQLIGDQFDTVTNGFGVIKKSIDSLNADVASLRGDLPEDIRKALATKSAEFNARWAFATLSAR